MAKLGVYLLLLCLSVLAAGKFGMLHNQLSYSIGPAYFHDLKFAQFGLPPDVSPRFGAALVGWRASWWMGLVVGSVPMTLALVSLPTAEHVWRTGMRALIVVICGTALSSVLGLAFGVATITPEVAATVSQNANITAEVGFLRAATMHDFTYMGGFVGIFAAIWVVRRDKRQIK